MKTHKPAAPAPKRALRERTANQPGVAGVENAMGNEKQQAAAVFEVGGSFGVEDSGGAVIYEPSFTYETAKEIARLVSRTRPPRDWESTRRLLVKRGFDVSVVEPRDAKAGSAQ